MSTKKFFGQILLASKSPRRRELLKMAGFDFRIISADIDEKHSPEMEPEKFPEYIAQQKAEAITSSAHPGEIILAADTIVLKDNIIFGKPADAADARRILKALSGAHHQVITGVFLSKEGKHKSFSVKTKVYFKDLSDEFINYYVEQYQPFDKAGAYAIQEWIGLVGIEKIEGCYFNVVGLPVSRLITELMDW